MFCCCSLITWNVGKGSDPERQTNLVISPVRARKTDDGEVHNMSLAL